MFLDGCFPGEDDQFVKLCWKKYNVWQVECHSDRLIIIDYILNTQWQQDDQAVQLCWMTYNVWQVKHHSEMLIIKYDILNT